MDCLAIFRTQMFVCGFFVFPHNVNHVSFEKSISLCSLLHRTFQVGYFLEKFGNFFCDSYIAKSILGPYVIIDY